MSFGGVNVTNLQKTYVNNIGVNDVRVTGLGLLSGHVGIIPSGALVLGYSGNNIVFGVPSAVVSTNGVQHLNVSGLSQISGDIAFIASGNTLLAYSGNNIIIGSANPALNGVTALSATGLSQISGNISFIPSGRQVIAYSGNNIVLGSLADVNSLGITGQTVLTGPIALIPSGEILMAYSGNNIIIGTPLDVNGLSLTGQSNLYGDIAIIPSGILQASYSGNNIVLGVPAPTVTFNGVQHLNITGLSQISGDIGFIPSGEIVLGYSGNNIVIGQPIDVDTLSITGQAGLVGNISLIGSGVAKLAYSGNNIVVGVPAPTADVSSLSITGGSQITGAIAFIPSGDLQMGYSGNNLVIGHPADVFIGSGNIFTTRVNGNVTISGSGVPYNVVQVTSLADLPAPSNGFITLEGTKIYRPVGIVNLDTNALICNGDTVLMGNHHRVDGFVSNCSGSMLNATGKLFEVANLLLSAPSGNLFNIVSGSRFLAYDNFFSGCLNLGSISGNLVVTMTDNRFANFTNGLMFYGAATYIRFDNNVITGPQVPTTTGFGIFSGSGKAINGFTFSDNYINFTQTGQTMLYVESGAVGLGYISSNIFSGNGASIRGGLAKSDVAWNFNDNLNLADSTRIAELYLSGGAVANNFASATDYLRVSGYSRTGQMERFIMSNSGEVTYVGKETFMGMVTACGRATAAAGTKQCVFTFLKNGAPIPNISFQTPTASTSNVFSVASTISLSRNDTVALAINNATDTTAVTVDGYNFIIS